MMDLKRFDRISGREALERLSGGLHIYNHVGTKIKIDFVALDYIWETSDNMAYFGEEDIKPIKLIDVLKGTWYVKKPFNIREEMVSRPNKWVGAFKNAFDQWCKVGFDSSEMSAVQAKLTNNKVPVSYQYTGVFLTKRDEIDRCIPIEDVPKEDLQ